MNNKLLQLSSSRSQQLHYYAILFFCFCLPIWSIGTVLAIIILLVNSIFSGQLYSNRTKLLHPIPLFSIALYLVYLLGLTYTVDVSDGLRDVETKLTILLFPLIFFTGPTLKTKQKEKAFLFFIVGCALATIAGVTQLWYYTKYMKTYPDAKFTHLVGIHSSYFCIYLGVGVFFLAKQLIAEKKTGLNKKIIYGSLVAIFIFAILNLYAKMGVYTLTLLYTVFYLGYKFQKGHYAKGTLQTVIALTLFLGVCKIIPAANHTFFGVVDIPKKTVTKERHPNVRLQIWKASLTTFRQQMLFGHGTGDVHVELLKTYKKNQFKKGIVSNYNPHNQYLQTGIALGLFGLFFLIGNFLVAMYFAWKGQHYFYLFFVLLFSICCLTESMLEMEKGVLFYAFFNSFFAVDLLTKEVEK